MANNINVFLEISNGAVFFEQGHKMWRTPSLQIFVKFSAPKEGFIIKGIVFNNNKHYSMFRTRFCKL